MEIKYLCDNKKEVPSNKILFEISKSRFDKNFKPSNKIDFSELLVPKEVLKKREITV